LCVLTRLPAFKPPKRSPTSYNGPRNRHLPSFSRFGQATANLSKIREESLDQEDDARMRDEAYHEFHTNELVEEQHNHDSEDEDDIADWDEETTLVAMMDNE